MRAMALLVLILHLAPLAGQAAHPRPSAPCEHAKPLTAVLISASAADAAQADCQDCGTTECYHVLGCAASGSAKAEAFAVEFPPQLAHSAHVEGATTGHSNYTTPVLPPPKA